MLVATANAPGGLQRDFGLPLRRGFFLRGRSPFSCSHSSAQSFVRAEQRRIGVDGVIQRAFVSAVAVALLDQRLKSSGTSASSGRSGIFMIGSRCHSGIG